VTTNLIAKPNVAKSNVLDKRTSDAENNKQTRVRGVHAGLLGVPSAPSSILGGRSLLRDLCEIETSFGANLRIKRRRSAGTSQRPQSRERPQGWTKVQKKHLHPLVIDAVAIENK
jgi:hypothetical protein